MGFVPPPMPKSYPKGTRKKSKISTSEGERDRDSADQERAEYMKQLDAAIFDYFKGDGEKFSHVARRPPQELTSGERAWYVRRWRYDRKLSPVTCLNAKERRWFVSVWENHRCKLYPVQEMSRLKRGIGQKHPNSYKLGLLMPKRCLVSDDIVGSRMLALNNMMDEAGHVTPKIWQKMVEIQLIIHELINCSVTGKTDCTDEESKKIFINVVDDYFTLMYKTWRRATTHAKKKAAFSDSQSPEQSGAQHEDNDETVRCSNCESDERQHCWENLGDKCNDEADVPGTVSISIVVPSTALDPAAAAHAPALTSAPPTAPAPDLDPASAPAAAFGLAESEMDDAAGNEKFFYGSSEAFGTVREEWYSSHWAFDLKFKDKTVSGEYILEKPPKKPGGSMFFHVLLLLFVAIEGADCHRVEKNVPVAPSDEEGFLSFNGSNLLACCSSCISAVHELA